MQQIRWLLAPDEAARARSIHLFCGIMETPGQLATEDLYVLDIPAPNATTVAHVSVNTEQVKTDRIREVLLTQIGATLPTAEIDWTSHTLPLRDLENDQLIAIDLNTGIAM